MAKLSAAQVKSLAHEFAQDPRGMEAKRPVSQQRDEMENNAAQAEAREGQHGIKSPRG